MVRKYRPQGRRDVGRQGKGGMNKGRRKGIFPNL
jgi:hypothetical protein